MVVRSSLGFVFGVAFTAGVDGVFDGVCGRVVDGVELGFPEFEGVVSPGLVLSGTIDPEFALEFVSSTTEVVAMGDG